MPPKKPKLDEDGGYRCNSGVNYNEELKEIDENISEIEKQVFELQDGKDGFHSIFNQKENVLTHVKLPLELKQITQKPDDIRLQADLETLTDKVSSLKKEIESTSKSKSLSLESISIIKKKELQINKECDKRFKIVSKSYG
ncbi:hypothetical protein WICMUC_005736 [Wickerhamomyces mucosus]|uniref:Uncharacterized protein n=1 Tax=Wickerhamomyces mucosus TaxID=1378264 RepID=A0A9P8T355_9ASCO|nr:hypothetical protein WICMUC_005736 [Wickerhamomyces mucosus]